jgi:hypothetical protein
MGQKMAYLEQAVLEHCLGRTPFTAPADLYVVASTAAFDPTLTGTSVVEPADGAYARVLTANDSTTWGVPTGSNPVSISNLVQWDFPAAGADWGAVLAVYLADAATVGNLLWGTDVGAGISINAGSTFQIPIGAFVIREF